MATEAEPSTVITINSLADYYRMFPDADPVGLGVIVAPPNPLMGEVEILPITSFNDNRAASFGDTILNGLM